MTSHHDGVPPTAERLADLEAIRSLAIAYGYAIDDQDWDRWAALFTPDAHIDYRSSAGIAGTTPELREWLPGAMSAMDWSMHSVLTHEIAFTGPDTATGRAHLFNRNGVTWEGEAEVLDVSGLYLDEYVRTPDGWRFSQRVEQSLAIVGGGFAAMLRSMIAGAQAGG